MSREAISRTYRPTIAVNPEKTLGAMVFMPVCLIPNPLRRREGGGGGMRGEVYIRRLGEVADKKTIEGKAKSTKTLNELETQSPDTRLNGTAAQSTIKPK